MNEVEQMPTIANTESDSTVKAAPTLRITLLVRSVRGYVVGRCELEGAEWSMAMPAETWLAMLWEWQRAPGRFLQLEVKGEEMLYG